MPESGPPGRPVTSRDGTTGFTVLAFASTGEAAASLAASGAAWAPARAVPTAACPPPHEEKGCPHRLARPSVLLKLTRQQPHRPDPNSDESGKSVVVQYERDRHRTIKHTKQKDK